MCCGLIFGVILVIWGISTIINNVFNLNIPVSSILFGFLLLYLGFQLITGYPRHSCWNCSTKTCMDESSVQFNDQTIRNNAMPLEYKTVFGKSKIDLSELTLEGLRAGTTPVMGTVNTVFGKTDLTLNKDIPTRIIAKSAFAKAAFPDNTMITFGTHTYNSHPNEQPLIIIYSSTVFGDLEVDQK